MSKFNYMSPGLSGSKHEKNIGFRLRLANGREWNLLGTEEVSPWLRNLARIFQLQTHELNGSSKLIFIQQDSSKENYNPVERLDSNLKAKLPQDGWETHDIKSMKFWSHPKSQDIICEIGEDPTYEVSVIRMWQALIPVYQKVQEEGGFSFHCGFVAKDGYGVLLAAPGNTGKSTCCRRIPAPWKAMSDDEALIVRDKNQGFMVHPFPTWSNFMWKREEMPNSWDTQQALPLKAIFFLEQAEADSVEPIGQGQAAIFINESARQLSRRNWRNLGPEKERHVQKKLFVNACGMAKQIPAYLLKVSLTGKFWEKMDEVLLIQKS